VITLEVVELENGRFTVRALGGLAPDLDAGEFDTKVEAEEWLFLKSEQLASGEDLGILLPGGGQGLS